MNKIGKGKAGVIILVLIIIGLLAWGYIVGQQTSNFSTCNISFWKFCWKWGTSVVK
ncbi:MAG: hypothetical protein WAU65_02540 [Candidatus Nanoarchaeia archaeon]